MAERFVQSVQRECQDHFLVFGEGNLRHILEEYLAHYHRCRPHQGLGNAPPDGSPEEGQLSVSLAEVPCQ